MTSILRFAVPEAVARGLAGSEALLDVYSSRLWLHWSRDQRLHSAAARALHGAAAAAMLRGRGERRRDLALCRRLGLLPRELAAARATLPEADLPHVVAAHVAKGIYHLLNPEAFPIAGNLLLDKARFGRVMREAGLKLPPTFEAGEALPAWASGAEALIYKPGFMSQGRGIARLERAGDGRWRSSAAPAETFDLAPWLARNLRRGDVVQRFLGAHASMREHSPGALPTLRVITCLDEAGAPEVTHAILRMGGGGSFMDNFHGEGVAASVDLAAGRTVRAATMTPGLRLRFRQTHPATGARLEGFAVPGFDASLAIARAAHEVVAPCGIVVVGWDIGLAEEGPLLIEGNWSPGTPVSQYLAGRAIGATRLGDLLTRHLLNLPPGAWRAAQVLHRSPRRTS